MCEHGDTVDVLVTVAADLSHTGSEYVRPFPIDRCIAPIVAALNAGGVVTRQSCCGHGQYPGTIDLADGRTLRIGPTHPRPRVSIRSRSAKEAKKIRQWWLHERAEP